MGILTYSALRRLDDKGICIAFGLSFGAAVVGVSLGLGIRAIFNSKLDNEMKYLNMKVAHDMNVDSFNAENILVDENDKTYVAKITGTATDKDGKDLNYAAANYKISEKDFVDLKVKIEGDNKAFKDMATTDGIEFVKNLFDLLMNSEFIDGTTQLLSALDGGEIVVDATQPLVDEENGEVSYNVTLSALKDKTLNMATFKISAPADEVLKDDPTKIYGKSKNDCKIEQIETKTFENVNFVDMRKDYTLIL